VAAFKQQNPYLSLAGQRAKAWKEFAARKQDARRRQEAAEAARNKQEEQRAAQRGADLAKLLKVLPLGSFSVERKLALVDAYEARYGDADGKAITAALPAAQLDQLCEHDQASGKLVAVDVRVDRNEYRGEPAGLRILEDAARTSLPGEVHVPFCLETLHVTDDGGRYFDVPVHLARGERAEVLLAVPRRWELNESALYDRVLGVEWLRDAGPEMTYDEARWSCYQLGAQLPAVAQAKALGALPVEGTFARRGAFKRPTSKAEALSAWTLADHADVETAFFSLPLGRAEPPSTTAKAGQANDRHERLCVRKHAQ
jgi:hypothetical protein